MNDEIEFNISFSDLTLCEANGSYEEVLDIMKSEDVQTEWMISSELTIRSEYGLAFFVLHFFYNKDVVIVQYSPTIEDVFYNPDLQVLSKWTQEKGWNIPNPTKYLVIENMNFWEHFWNVNLIDSPYLDKLRGKRSTDVEEQAEDIFD